MFAEKRVSDDKLIGSVLCKSMNTYPYSNKDHPLIISVDVEALETLSDIPTSYGTRFNCKHCHAYISTYSNLTDSPSRWQCPICKVYNPLPLPPSNSFDTGYSVAKRSIPTNSLIYDFIDIKEQNLDLKPHIILAIHSEFPPSIIQFLIDTLKTEENNTEYTLIIFGQFLDVYCFAQKKFYRVCHETDNALSIFMPAPYEQLKGNSIELKAALPTIRMPAKGNCFKSLMQLIKIFPECHSRKLFCLLVGEETKNTFPQSLITTHFIVLSSSPDCFYELANPLQPTDSKAIRIDNLESEQNIVLVARNIDIGLNRPSLGNLKIDLHGPKEVKISRVCHQGAVFTVDRQLHTDSRLFFCLQLEANFKDPRGRSVTRILTLKVPLQQDNRIIRGVTFKNTFGSLFAAASYFVELVRSASKSAQATRVRFLVMEASHRFRIGGIFPNFVFGLLGSRLLDGSDPARMLAGSSALRTEAPVAHFAAFCPLELVRGEVRPAVPAPNPGATARIDAEGIQVLGAVREGLCGDEAATAPIKAAEELLARIGVCRPLDRPARVVAAFDPLPDRTAAFEGWLENWRLSSYRFFNQEAQ